MSPPTPPATPATPTPATPAASNCCQTLGSCPEGYQSSGTVVPNTACCKDLSQGISISSDMPYCPTTSPFGPIATPTIGSIPTPHTETGLGPIETGNPNGIFGPSDSVFGPSKSPFGPQGFGGRGMGMGGPGAITTPSYKNEGY